ASGGGPVIHARAPCHFGLALAGGVRANAGEREGLPARPHSGHGGQRLWRRNRHICEKYRYGDYPHSAHPHSAHPPSGVNCVNSMRRPAVGYKFRKYKFRRRHYSKRRCRFNPQIAEAHFAGAFDLNPNQPVLAELSGVVVNQHRHHVPVEDVNHLVAVRDDVVLVPVVDLDVAAEFVLVADGRQQPRLLALFRPHHLTAPSHDSARRAAFVILAAIAIGAVEIGLRTAHVPFGFRRRIRRPPPPPAGTPPPRPPRRSTRRTGSAPAGVHLARRLDEAAILYAAIHARAFAPQFRFQFE